MQEKLKVLHKCEIFSNRKNATCIRYTSNRARILIPKCGIFKLNKHNFKIFVSSHLPLIHLRLEMSYLRGTQ